MIDDFWGQAPDIRQTCKCVCIYIKLHALLHKIAKLVCAPVNFTGRTEGSVRESVFIGDIMQSKNQSDQHNSAYTPIHCPPKIQRVTEQKW